MRFAFQSAPTRRGERRAGTGPRRDGRGARHDQPTNAAARLSRRPAHSIQAFVLFFPRPIGAGAVAPRIPLVEYVAGSERQNHNQ